MVLEQLTADVRQLGAEPQNPRVVVDVLNDELPDLVHPMLARLRVPGQPFGETGALQDEFFVPHGAEVAVIWMPLCHRWSFGR